MFLAACHTHIPPVTDGHYTLTLQFHTSFRRVENLMLSCVSSTVEDRRSINLLVRDLCLSVGR